MTEETKLLIPFLKNSEIIVKHKFHKDKLKQNGFRSVFLENEYKNLIKTDEKKNNR